MPCRLYLVSTMPLQYGWFTGFYQLNIIWNINYESILPHTYLLMATTLFLQLPLKTFPNDPGGDVCIIIVNLLIIITNIFQMWIKDYCFVTISQDEH